MLEQAVSRRSTVLVKASADEPKKILMMGGCCLLLMGLHLVTRAWAPKPVVTCIHSQCASCTFIDLSRTRGKRGSRRLLPPEGGVGQAQSN